MNTDELRGRKSDSVCVCARQNKWVNLSVNRGGFSKVRARGEKIGAERKTEEGGEKKEKKLLAKMQMNPH